MQNRTKQLIAVFLGPIALMAGMFYMSSTAEPWGWRLLVCIPLASLGFGAMAYFAITPKLNERSAFGIAVRVVTVLALLGMVFDLMGKKARLNSPPVSAPQSLSDVLKTMDESQMTDKEQYNFANNLVGKSFITTKRGNSGVCLDVSTATAQARKALALVIILTSTHRIPKIKPDGKHKDSAQANNRIFWNHFEADVADVVVERFQKLGAKATRIDNESTEDGHWKDQ